MSPRRFVTVCLALWVLAGSLWAKPTLYIIGDSTVRNGTGGQMGWGDPLVRHFDPARIEVVNRAIGGRSSRTFPTEGRWDAVMANLKAGDFVLVQFGHNDSGPVNDDRCRASLKGIGDESEKIVGKLDGREETVHTYGWYLRKYASDAKSKGAVPILVSPIPRNIWKDGRIGGGGSGHSLWARQLAEREGLLFIDFNAILTNRYEVLGPEGAARLFAGADHTHTGPEGAAFNAAVMVEAIRSLKDCHLSKGLLPADLWLPSVFSDHMVLQSGMAAMASPAGFLKQPDAWFAAPEGRAITARILSWQSEHGAWPKNTDTTRDGFVGDRSEIKGTFDNKATTDELRYLARAFSSTGDQSCRIALMRGIDHILEAQYPNGGFPQYFPPGKQYHRHITFNDGCMIRLLELLREVATADSYHFIDPPRRAAAATAVERGIICIIKCQIVVRGTATVWCAQHDEVTLAAAPARSYELSSLSGSESAGILHFLMSLEKPSPQVIRAVTAGVEWFRQSRVEGIRIEKINGARQAIEDSNAPAIWARFYDLETHKPFFCDRDGVKKWSYNEIGTERRNGYAWYGNWGDEVLKTFAKWPHR